MKLYLSNCPNCGYKRPLDLQASTRNALRRHFGGDTFYATCGNCGYNDQHNVRNVVAYSDSNVTPGSAIAGGLIGLLGGPLGMVIGGLVGGVIGSANDTGDQRLVDIFNQSM